MEAMKDSGIEGIGLVPVEWNTSRRIKDIFTPSKGLSITKEDLVDEGVPVISYGQVHSKENNGITVIPSLIRYVEERQIVGNAKSRVHQGDFIFADTSEDLEGCGNCVYVDSEGVLYAGYHTIIFSSENKDNRYLAYLFKTDAWRLQIRKNVYAVKVYTVSQKILKECKLLLPSQHEQEAIADYLDARCAELDSIIADIEKQIETLKAYKKSLITETVTKGLDKSVSMKDSGMQWIGYIPTEWTINKIKYVCNLVRGGSPRPIDDYLSDDPKDINWVRIGDTKKDCKYIDSTELKIIPSGVSRSRYIAPGTLLLTNSMSFGQPYIMNIYGCIHDGWLAFSDYEGITKEYLYYTLMSESCLNQFQWMAMGAVVENLSIDKVSNVYLPIPPLREQQRITEYLDCQLPLIDETIAQQETLLSIMLKHKQSLIFEYVTGKKRVKEVR